MTTDGIQAVSTLTHKLHFVPHLPYAKAEARGFAFVVLPHLLRLGGFLCGAARGKFFLALPHGVAQLRWLWRQSAYFP